MLEQSKRSSAILLLCCSLDLFIYTMAAPFNLQNLLNLQYGTFFAPSCRSNKSFLTAFVCLFPCAAELNVDFGPLPSTDASVGPFNFQRFAELPNGGDPVSFVRMGWSVELPASDDARMTRAEAWYMGSLGAAYVNKVFVKVPAFFANVAEHFYLITFTNLTLNNSHSNQQNVNFNNGNIDKLMVHGVRTVPVRMPLMGNHTIDAHHYSVVWHIGTEESAVMDV